jgi:hypothetical protein
VCFFGGGQVLALFYVVARLLWLLFITAPLALIMGRKGGKARGEGGAGGRTPLEDEGAEGATATAGDED